MILIELTPQSECQRRCTLIYKVELQRGHRSVLELLVSFGQHRLLSAGTVIGQLGQLVLAFDPKTGPPISFKGRRT